MTPALGWRLLTAAIVALLAAIGSRASAQDTPKDYNQRSLEIFEFRKAARSGVERGQEIFYYKCWFCHNEFVTDVPHIAGLYKKATMLSGEPVNDANVKEKIRNGGPRNAAYKDRLQKDHLKRLLSFP